jgi:hypothetical protein
MECVYHPKETTVYMVYVWFNMHKTIDFALPFVMAWYLSNCRQPRFNAQVALHNYVNKIIRDTVPQEYLLENVEITVISYLKKKWIMEDPSPDFSPPSTRRF